MELFSNNLDKISTVIILLAMSLYLRILLQIVGQSWIKTIAHTSTLLLLPILTYVITSVISGNIALSLGMVGALSIVRFRNPVRSPLELSVYFGAITMGIAASVSLKWLILFIGAVTMVSIVLYLSNKIYLKLFKKPFFTTSFSASFNRRLRLCRRQSESPVLFQSKNTQIQKSPIVHQMNAHGLLDPARFDRHKTFPFHIRFQDD